jgi:3-phosphoshikimate 1-carboxyvinyltransferase
MIHQPSPYKLITPGIMEGTLVVPPSKSISHRLLIMAALSQKKCSIKNILCSDDIHITLDALNKMGFIFELTDNTVQFVGKHNILTERVHIYLENSGTSARLLTAVAATMPGEFILDGSERMRERPMLPLIEALNQLGSDIVHNRGYLPIRIRGKRLTGGEVTVEVSQSSQFLTALLLIAPLLREGLVIYAQGNMASRSYVDLTLSLLAKYKIQFKTEDNKIYIPGNQLYQVFDTIVEGDFSSASYFAVGPVISGGEIYLKNLDKNSRQGDIIILEILKQAGARVEWESNGVRITSAKLKGIKVNLQSHPDIVPTVAVMALFSEGTSILKNVSHLRFKESDRLGVLVENIERLGGSASINGGDLFIEPRPLKGNSLLTYNDHRMAMSFALVGLRIPGVKIENPDCVKKSFPNFWDEFERLVRPV